ncbi:uncharacterized protein PG998_008471 [Apiospora kogelbergensis]|uniref:uncharacterized protein n=1 Tax=Apiospora kogelbergensis TaxID=1337665 RepID=UPI00312EAAE4
MAMKVYEGIWRKRYFVPSWIIQCLVSGFFFVAACLILWATSLLKDDYSLGVDYDLWRDADTRKWLIGEGVYMLLLTLYTIISAIVESSLFHRRRLAPKTVTILAIVRTLGWLVYLIVSAVATARAVSGALDVILGLIMVASALVQLYYGAKFTHKERKGQLLQPGAAGGNKVGDAEYGMHNFAPAPNNHNTASYA